MLTYLSFFQSKLLLTVLLQRSIFWLLKNSYLHFNKTSSSHILPRFAHNNLCWLLVNKPENLQHRVNSYLLCQNYGCGFKLMISRQTMTEYPSVQPTLSAITTQSTLYSAPTFTFIFLKDTPMPTIKCSTMQTIQPQHYLAKFCKQK